MIDAPILIVPIAGGLDSIFGESQHNGMGASAGVDLDKSRPRSQHTRMLGTSANRPAERAERSSCWTESEGGGCYD